MYKVYVFDKEWDKETDTYVYKYHFLGAEVDKITEAIKERINLENFYPDAEVIIVNE